MDKNKFDCDSMGMWCYDCPYRHCRFEDEKYDKLKRRTEDHIKDGLYWIDIDFERADEVSQRAFARYRKWLEAEKGCVGREPSYKKWISYNEYTREPATGCGYHTGTFYFHKKQRKG